MQKYRFCGIATNKTGNFYNCSRKQILKLLVLTMIAVFLLFRFVLNKNNMNRFNLNYVVKNKNTVNFVSEMTICSGKAVE
jgi:hypothetical protein